MAQRYLSERAKKFSNNSFNVYRQEGKRLFAWGIQQELLPRGMRNPFQQVEKKRHEKTKPTPPTIENVGKVYMVATPIQKQILLSYLLTGARKSEILKMELTDADLIKRIYALHTRKSGTGELKTTYHDMSELFYQILKDRFEKRHPNLPYVFWHRYWDRKEKRWREDRYKSLNKFTKRLCQKAGVPHFHLHQLRHLTTAILKELGNMDLAKLQRFLRHDKQKTTEIYAGHIETGTKAQTDFLSNFWSKNLPNPDKSSTTASTKQKKTG